MIFNFSSIWKLPSSTKIWDGSRQDLKFYSSDVNPFLTHKAEDQGSVASAWLCQSLFERYQPRSILNHVSMIMALWNEFDRFSLTFSREAVYRMKINVAFHFKFGSPHIFVIFTNLTKYLHRCFFYGQLNFSKNIFVKYDSSPVNYLSHQLLSYINLY